MVLKILELFSGTKSVGKVAEEMVIQSVVIASSLK